MTLKLSVADARELAYGGDFTAEGLTVEADIQVAEKRWTAVNQLVVRDRDGRLWAATYERGLTEHQEMSPWEDHRGDVEFTEVEKVSVPMHEYRPKSAARVLPERHPQVTFTNAITSCPTEYQQRSYPDTETAFEAAVTGRPYNNTSLHLSWCTEDHDTDQEATRA